MLSIYLELLKFKTETGLFISLTKIKIKILYILAAPRLPAVAMPPEGANSYI
ncbi:hypothetical protein DOJK_01684 [Patescibacteria group bacterium]|nr:hypothetical protein DOJK_01684 [Patescibacteria group bacterium]